MKYFSIFIIFTAIIFNNHILKAEDALTIKQQLDRIREEVKDLNKAVFNKSFNKNEIDLSSNENDSERFTSIDIRIYDLEKDIKNLTLQLEEILFKLDDISNNMDSLESELITKFENIKIDNGNNDDNLNLDYSSISSTNDENTLGKIVITESNEVIEESENTNLVIEEQKNNKIIEDEYINLSPEEQLQYALDKMMKKNYAMSKEVLEKFVVNFPNNQLSGSAHFWLGKIYLFESNYRKAAIIFGEGVQKFPKSIKAPEMYYELAKSLNEMQKTSEACKTLSLLEEKYKDNKFSKDPEKIKAKLNCQNIN